MKLIALEGLDHSGKATLVTRLSEYLKQQGNTHAVIDFPRYSTPIGKLISTWLTDKKEAVSYENKYAFELLQAADKQGFQDSIARLEQDGIEYLILDRYIDSEIVYGLASGIDQDWLTQLTKNMRQPDLSVFIDISVNESMSRTGKWNNGKNDFYESNYTFLDTVRSIYKNRIPYQINGEQSKEDVFRDLIELLKKEGIIVE